STRSVSLRSYPAKSFLAIRTWRSSTGVYRMQLLLVQALEHRVDDAVERDQREKADDRRKVDLAGRKREHPPPEPQVGLAHVEEEALHRPQRVRQLHPRREDVREQRQRIHADED